MSAQISLIEDLDDPRLEVYRSMREKDLKGREGFFIGEGPLTVERMLTMEGVAVSALMTEAQCERLAPHATDDVDFLVASKALLSQIVGFNFHRGSLAAGRRAPFEGRSLAEILAPLKPAASLLLIDGVTNIDNIGLLFRNAAAFGVDAVLLSGSCHDPLYRKALRCSLGHVLTTPYTRCADWPSTLEALKAAGFEICSAALGPGAISLDDYEVPDRCALVVGQEFQGVSEASLAASDRILKIPMAPGVDSLNVAAASAVCLHRLSRGERA